MARRRELKIYITGNAEDAKRAFREVDASAGKLGTLGAGLKRVGKIGAVAFGGLATAGVAFGAKAIKSASDLNETVAATGAVFKDSTKSVIAAADEMQRKFGTNKQVFLEGASSLGSIAKASGLVGGEAAKLSVDFTKLGADLSSFKNIPMEEALGAIRSGLVGEAEPLRRFGVLLSEAAVQTEAVSLGIAKQGEKLTEAQKVQARASLITKGLADAHGDLARTADSPANAMRRLQGQIQAITASVGAALLPVVKALMPVLNALVPILGEALGGVAKALAPLLVRVATALGPILSKVVKALTPVLDVLGAALGDILVALLPLLPPLALLLQAFTPLIPPLAKLVTLLVKMLMPLLTPLIGLVGALASVMSHVLAKAIGVLTTLLSPLGAIFRAIGRAIEPVIRFVRGLARTIGRLKLPDWLIPGSPTPLELGLRGITKAFKDARQIAHGFAIPDAALAARPLQPALAGAAAGGVVINLNGAVLGDVPRVVDQIRRELLKGKGRNGTTGL